MTSPKEITTSITDRFFTIDLPIDDEKLIASVLLGLAQYVKSGNSLKVKQSYITFSGTQEIITKFISRPNQVAEWGKETKRCISALKKR
jgi:hypothetical protein